MKIKSAIILASVIASILILITACSKGSNEGNTPEEKNTPIDTVKTVIKSFFGGQHEQIPDLVCGKMISPSLRAARKNRDGYIKMLSDPKYGLSKEMAEEAVNNMEFDFSRLHINVITKSNNRANVSADGTFSIVLINPESGDLIHKEKVNLNNQEYRLLRKNGKWVMCR